MMIFGLYGRFGTRQGAWSALLSGMALALMFLFLQRNWADMVYPFLDRNELVESVGGVLSAVSAPLNPFVVWEMNPYKFPINGYESYFMIMLFTLFLYIGVSYATLKEPFNLDRMLHRGVYNIDGTDKKPIHWSLGHIFNLLAGITPMHSVGDKWISWSVLFYSYIYQFVGCFLSVVVWNAVSPWPITWWGNYFLITFILIPSVVATITAVWFGIGGIVDLRRLFRALKNRTVDDLDNGMVKDGVAASDFEAFKKLDRKK